MTPRAQYVILWWVGSALLTTTSASAEDIGWRFGTSLSYGETYSMDYGPTAQVPAVGFHAGIVLPVGIALGPVVRFPVLPDTHGRYDVALSAGLDARHGEGLVALVLGGEIEGGYTWSFSDQVEYEGSYLRMALQVGAAFRTTDLETALVLQGGVSLIGANTSVRGGADLSLLVQLTW